MNIYEIQKNIVQQLQHEFDKLQLPYRAMDLPDAPANYNRALVNPVVYVVYTGSTADPSIAMPPVAQIRRLNFDLEIHARSLYADNGMFAARDVVEQAIIGFMPDNAHQIYLKSDEVSQIEDTLWVHVLKVECTARLVQRDFSEPIVVPELKEIINRPLNHSKGNKAKNIITLSHH